MSSVYKRQSSVGTQPDDDLLEITSRLTHTCSYYVTQNILEPFLRLMYFYSVICFIVYRC